jgi:hypothetical protein
VLLGKTGFQNRQKYSVRAVQKFLQFGDVAVNAAVFAIGEDVSGHISAVKLKYHGAPLCIEYSCRDYCRSENF